MEKLKANIIQGRRYHYIHGYGKNGKTTFNKRFIHENDDVFYPLCIDFSDSAPNNTEYSHRLILVIINYFNALVYQHNNCIDIIMECINHISNARLEINTSNPAYKLRTEYLSIFSSIRDQLVEFIIKIRTENNKRQRGNLAELFNIRFESFILEEYRKDNLKITNELFYLLLLVCLKIYNEQPHNKRLLFIFDNIDDILTTSSEYMSSILIPNIDKFIGIIERFINLNSSFIKEDIISQTSFIFTYRTANYASSMVTIKNESAKERVDELLAGPVYALSSVNYTNDIIRKKLNFYEDISEVFNFEKSSNFDFLNSILNSYHLNVEKNDKHIAKLWNGNSFAFSKCFYYLCQTNIKCTKEDLEALNNDSYRNILRGIFTHCVVKFYCDDTNTPFSCNSTLLDAFLYIFRREMDEDNVCNLLRLFLSYIVNFNDRNQRQNENVGSNNDIFVRGVGLYDVLKELSKLRHNGKRIYNKKNYIELFKAVFHGEIDSLDYFIVCVKKMNNYQHSPFIKTYDFTKELDMFFSTKVSEKTKEAHLNSVKIYYNSNAKFFLNIIKKHFEVFSAITNNQFPLPLNIQMFPQQGIIGDFKLEYGFNNEAILKEVFKVTSNIVKTTVNFYISHVSKIYRPKEFCQDSYFTDKTFLFSTIIPNHITYIEKTRQLIINQCVGFEFKNKKSDSFLSNKKNVIPTPKMLVDINARFIYWIEEYIKLFKWAYKEIEKATGEIDTSSEATLKIFNNFEIQIDNKIKRSKYNDFSTKIEQ